MTLTLEQLEAKKQEIVSYTLEHLQTIQRNVVPDTDEKCIDVRLQLTTENDESEEYFSYDILWGDSQYDIDHSGFWAYSTVLEEEDTETLQSTANEMFEQVADSFATSV
jgi:hypothetical protein